MNKMQNYFKKPQQLKKKLQNPKFRQTFVQWSKSNISLTKDNNQKNTRLKSPLQACQRTLNMPKKTLLSKQKRISNKQNQAPSRSSPKLKVYSKQKGKKCQFLTKPYHSTKSLDKQLKPSQKQLKSHSLRHNSASCRQIPQYKCQKDKIVEPSKIQFRYSYRTKQGVQINNPNKTNQDSLLIKTNFLGSSSVFAIADGHGVYGHYVSQYLVKNIANFINTQYKKQEIKSMLKSGKASIVDTLPQAYNRLQQDLLNSQQINANCSGSTLVNVIIQNDQIICANVGDSRAILARQIDKKNWQMIYLSQDHKPTIQGEKRRILKSGGKIHAFKDQKGLPVGPQRVWLPNQNMQGLAMSRSFGDNVSKPIGVTHIPQIIRLKIDKKDKFLLLASDGIWEFISNQEVLQLLVPFYRDGKLEEACDALVSLAYDRWTVDDKSIVDDITLILVFFTNANNSN